MLSFAAKERILLLPQEIMGTVSPISITLTIVVVVSAVGMLIAVVRNANKFQSYGDLRRDVRAIARALGGEIFRDGDDLVISGNQRSWPAVVRFSYVENTPGLDIRMEVPASFTLWAAPRSAGATEGRALLRSSNAMFDTHFALRSDHPTQANMLLASRQTASALQRLCCSANTFVAVTRGAIELREMITPRPYTGRHVLDHLTAMAAMGEFLKSMPGADEIKIRPIRREAHLVARLAIAAGVVVTLIAVAAATHSTTRQKVAASGPVLPEGIAAADAPLIPSFAKCRVATPQDFDSNATAWLRGYGLEVLGRIPGNFTGKGEANEVAYALIGKGGAPRLVLLAGGERRYDASFPRISLVARVPHSAFKSIQWVGQPPANPDGDGLLILRQVDDPTSALVLFLSGPKIVSGVPQKYQSIRLLE